MTTTKTKSVITPDSDAIVSEIHIAAPPDRVFKALTDPAELMRWFTSPECPAKFWEMDARPGGRYRYATEKGTVVVNGVSEFECHGEILQLDPRIFSSIRGLRTGTTTSPAPPSCVGSLRQTPQALE
jgi:hypothetical protein